MCSHGEHSATISRLHDQAGAHGQHKLLYLNFIKKTLFDSEICAFHVFLTAKLQKNSHIFEE